TRPGVPDLRRAVPTRRGVHTGGDDPRTVRAERSRSEGTGVPPERERVGMAEAMDGAPIPAPGGRPGAGGQAPGGGGGLSAAPAPPVGRPRVGPPVSGGGGLPGAPPSPPRGRPGPPRGGPGRAPAPCGGPPLPQGRTPEPAQQDREQPERIGRGQRR